MARMVDKPGIETNSVKLQEQRIALNDWGIQNGQATTKVDFTSTLTSQASNGNGAESPSVLVQVYGR